MLDDFETTPVESYEADCDSLEGCGFGRNYSEENGNGGPFEA